MQKIILFTVSGWILLSSSPIKADSKIRNLKSSEPTVSSSVRLRLKSKANIVASIIEQGPKCFLDYQPWYRTARHGWTHWALFNHQPQDIDSTDIASVHMPLSGLYDSSDPALIAYHIELAKAMGLDGYVVHWEGDTIWHDDNIPLILDEAEKQGIVIALRYKSTVAGGDIRLLKNHLKNFLDKHSHHPAYQKIGGLPVIHLFDMVASGFSPKDYARVTRELKEENGSIFVIMGDTAQFPEYFYNGRDETGVASAMYEWINMGAYMSHPSYKENPQVWETKARAQSLQSAQGRSDRIVFGSFYAGFDDLALGGGDWGKGTRRYLPDLKGNVLRKTVDYILEEGYLWNYGITFNDWNEGTEMEPSFEKGFSRIWGTIRLVEKSKGLSVNRQKIIEIVEKFTRLQHKGKLDRKRRKIFKQARRQARGKPH